MKFRYVFANAVRNANLCHHTEKTYSPIIDDVYAKLTNSDRSMTMKKPSWYSVWRWWKKFLAAGFDIRALIDRHWLKGNRKKRYSDDFYHFIRKAINEKYLNKQRFSVQDTVDHAINMIAEENKLRHEEAQLPLPTYAVVKREISKLDAFDVCVARYGYQAARAKFRSAQKKMLSDSILDRAEIDHTRLDLMVIDERSNLPLGRPNITLCIDVKSRCILGVYIGFEPPSFLSVMLCLKHAFVPKNNLNEIYPSINGVWESFGVPRIGTVDNGLEFHGDNHEHFAYQAGMTIEIVERKTGWHKPHIERFNGTLARALVHGLPGTTFSNIFERGDYNSAKKAVLTLSVFKEMLFKWVVDVYHQTPHRGLGGRTPLEVWREESEDIVPWLPTELDEIDGFLGGVKEKTLSHNGIVFDYIEYNSPDLKELLLKKGFKLKVRVRYNPADLGVVYVEHPDTGKLMRVAAKRQDYANGLSEYQHRLIRKYYKNKYKRSRADIEKLAKAKADVMAIMEKFLFDKSMKTRSKVARFNEFGPGNPVNPSDGQDKTNTDKKSSKLGKTVKKFIVRNKDDDMDAPDFELV